MRSGSGRGILFPVPAQIAVFLVSGPFQIWTSLAFVSVLGDSSIEFYGGCCTRVLCRRCRSLWRLFGQV